MVNGCDEDPTQVSEKMSTNHFGFFYLFVYCPTCNVKCIITK